MSKPRIIIDPQPRTVDLIFDASVQTRLADLADLTIFDSGPMPAFWNPSCILCCQKAEPI
jgi:hypothetical protein